MKSPLSVVYNLAMIRSLPPIAAIFSAALCTSLCAASTPDARVTAPDRYREFVSACIQAFDQSSSNGSLGVGRQICECTAKESKHEGVTRSSLQRETAKIKADSKYQIQDQKLLNAFHYCTIETLHDS